MSVSTELTIVDLIMLSKSVLQNCICFTFVTVTVTVVFVTVFVTLRFFTGLAKSYHFLEYQYADCGHPMILLLKNGMLG